MTKSKTWADLARSLDADWPPRQSDPLVAEARAVSWDFSDWCYAEREGRLRRALLRLIVPGRLSKVSVGAVVSPSYPVRVNEVVNPRAARSAPV